MERGLVGPRGLNSGEKGYSQSVRDESDERTDVELWGVEEDDESQLVSIDEFADLDEETEAQ